MGEITDGQVYEAIGSAVVASQLFERIFIVASKLAIKQDNIESLDQVVPVLAKKAFKQPVKALLKELDGLPLVANLEQRILKLIENRHRVVHRLVEETGWPISLDQSQRFEIRELCLEVMKESLDLHTAFLKILVEWGKRFPELHESFSRVDTTDMYVRGHD